MQQHNSHGLFVGSLWIKWCCCYIYWFPDGRFSFLYFLFLVVYGLMVKKLPDSSENFPPRSLSASITVFSYTELPKNLWIDGSAGRRMEGTRQSSSSTLLESSPKKYSSKVGLLNLSAWPPPPWSWDNQNQTRNWAHTYLFKSFDQTRPDQVCLCPAWWLFNKWNFITLKYVEKQNAILHKLRPNCAKSCKLKPSYYPPALLSVMY